MKRWYEQQERFSVRELTGILGVSKSTVLRFLSRHRVRTRPRVRRARTKITVSWNSLLPFLGEMLVL